MTWDPQATTTVEGASHTPCYVPPTPHPNGLFMCGSILLSVFWESKHFGAPGVQLSHGPSKLDNERAASDESLKVTNVHEHDDTRPQLSDIPVYVHRKL